MTISSKAKEIIVINEFNFKMKILLNWSILNRNFKQKVIYLHFTIAKNDNQIVKRLFFKGIPIFNFSGQPSCCENIFD